ncbi:hypothetical protein [Candidatus Nitrospira bockiana]
MQTRLTAAAVAFAALAGGALSLADAGGFRSPEECLAYSGDAHLNCLYAYIEIQQGKLTKLQEELNTVRAAKAQLQDQVSRDALQADALRRSLTERERRADRSPSLHMAPFLGYWSSFGPPGPYGFHYGYRFFGPSYGPAFPCW